MFKQRCYVYEHYQWAGELLSGSEDTHGKCSLFLESSVSINRDVRDEQQLVDLNLHVLEKTLQVVKMCTCQLPFVGWLV